MKKQEQSASDAARALGRKRWAGTTPEERVAAMAEIQAQIRPREHCPCGAMTVERAAKRNHRCEAPKPARKAKTG